MLNHLKKTIQHAPNLAHVIGGTALRTDGIKFIEEIDTSKVSDGI